MTKHIHNRTLLLAALRRELVGPDPVPGAKPLNLQKLPIFKNFQEKRGPWIDAQTGQEIISQDTPTKRYGVGVLHPVPEGGDQGAAASEQQEVRRDEDLLSQEDFAPAERAEVTEGTPDPEGTVEVAKNLDAVKERVERAQARPGPESDPEDAFDVSGANGFRPSGMALSFLADVPEDAVLRVTLPSVLPPEHAFGGMAVNGRYQRVAVKRQAKAKRDEVPTPQSVVQDGAAQRQAEVQTLPTHQSGAEPAASPVSETDDASQTTSASPDLEQKPGGTATVQGETVSDVLWARTQVEAEYEVSGRDLLASRGRFLKLQPTRSSGLESLNLSLEILARPVASAGEGTQRLITVNLVNRTAGDASSDQHCLFQVFFEVHFERGGEIVPVVFPYPKPPREDPEERSNALLYRNTPTFAAGHGCAADWVAASPERALSLRVECLPVHEVPSITPDIERRVFRDGVERLEKIAVPMRGLAGLETGFDIVGSLQAICDAYEQWVGARRTELPSLPAGHRTTGEEHMLACERALERMRGGLRYLVADPRAMQAFKWANHAILLQQLRGDLSPRPAIYDAAQETHTIRGPYPLVTDEPEGSRGRWRAFQIAFLLLAVESAAKGEHPDRDVVDLIWFPTGGGKTEAYLGLSAFSLFMRRLINPEDAGVHILMRYTLRLLTAQQFQRATGLMCAMEYLRRQHEEELGDVPFSGGIWVGGSTTPNRREDAVKALRAIEKDKSEKNPFLITRCPWCGAEMGPVEHASPLADEDDAPKRKRKGARSKAAKAFTQVSALGYEQREGTVALHCPDRHCDFRQELPIYVVDEDTYERRPSLIIGTVDKFAMLAWRPEARSLFGIGLDGEREVSPPGLVIQDELHLISGPLGSMAGLFEGVVEELCTDRRGGREVRPKLVCSTATIRAYREQVQALYARDRTELFPPPGLDVSDSFFAQYARDKDGGLSRGRMYVGVNGPGHGSMQTTQVRTFSALLQFPKTLDAAAQDPWWTLLAFFNSLRELGTTVTLFQSDIPDYLKILDDRYALPKGGLRNPWGVKELTGRLDSEEVPRAIKDLEVVTDNQDGQAPVDVCLASSIIEVGVDIGRLSLMAIVGQPKTTSQYIQVSGRVGRRWWDRPGVVVMLYNASKPRDRSHFEKFRSYHEQLYAQVEPTSVTPFSPPALDRGLRAALVAFIRQQAEMTHDGPAKTPKVYPEALGDAFAQMILARVQQIDPAERENVERVLGNARRGWIALKKEKYQVRGAVGIDNPGLLTPAGQHVNPGARDLTWMTPQSLRNVDATCEAKITRLPLLDAVRRTQEERADG